jgi:putative transcriptional regulator
MVETAAAKVTILGVFYGRWRDLVVGDLYEIGARQHSGAHPQANQGGAMTTMTGEELGEKLLRSVNQMKRGDAARTTHVELTGAAKARARTSLTQSQFANLLGVSARTLQDWEQGRREPTGAAKTLLRVAATHPRVLRELTP